MVGGDKSNLTITDSEMRSNEQHGMIAQTGACMTARGCIFKANLGAGVLASHSGSRAGVIGGQVLGNRVGLVALDQGLTPVATTLSVLPLPLLFLPRARAQTHASVCT